MSYTEDYSVFVNDCKKIRKFEKLLSDLAVIVDIEEQYTEEAGAVVALIDKFVKQWGDLEYE